MTKHEALEAIAGWLTMPANAWEERFPVWEARYRALGGTINGDHADLSATVDLFIEIAQAALEGEKA